MGDFLIKKVGTSSTNTVESVFEISANTIVCSASTGGLTAKDFTDFALTLVDDSTAAAARTTLQLNPAITFTIAPSGAQYTTIQAALTANATANATFLVYPGTYTNDTIAFTANNQCVVGVGTQVQQIVTNTVTIVDCGAFTGCNVQNLTLTGTYTVDTTPLLTGSGSGNFIYCILSASISGILTGNAALISGTGSFDFDDCTISYANTANYAGGIKRAIDLGAGAQIDLSRCIITQTGSGTSVGHTFAYGTSTGVCTLNRCEINISDAAATLLAGIYIAGSGINYLAYNRLSVTGGGTDAYGILTASTAVVNTNCNTINVSGSSNNCGLSAGTGSTLNSSFDVVVATTPTGGAGTISFIVGNNAGALDVSDSANTLTNIGAGNVIQTIEQDSSTIRYVTASDKGKVIEFTSASPVTVALSSSVFSANDVCQYVQTGANTFSLSASGISPPTIVDVQTITNFKSVSLLWQTGSRVLAIGS